MRSVKSNIMVALEELLRGGDPERLQEAVGEFLACYGELRSEIAEMPSQGQPGFGGEKARVLAVEMRRGALPYPFTDEGKPIVPGMRVVRPDGATCTVDHIEIRGRSATSPVTLWFTNGDCYHGKIYGFHAPIFAAADEKE